MNETEIRGLGGEINCATERVHLGRPRKMRIFRPATPRTAPAAATPFIDEVRWSSLVIVALLVLLQTPSPSVGTQFVPASNGTTAAAASATGDHVAHSNISNSVSSDTLGYSNDSFASPVSPATTPAGSERSGDGPWNGSSASRPCCDSVNRTEPSGSGASPQTHRVVIEFSSKIVQNEYIVQFNGYYRQRERQSFIQTALNGSKVAYQVDSTRRHLPILDVLYSSVCRRRFKSGASCREAIRPRILPVISMCSHWKNRPGVASRMG